MATIPSLALIPSGYKASKVYSVLPTDGTGDFDFTRSGNATRVNSEGLIELVSTNVPRLNYPLIDGVVSGCPSLLLELQRLQLIQYSEDFDNAYWTNTEASTVSANVGVSPDGYTNADKLIPQATSNFHRLSRSFTVTTATPYTFSAFVKRAGYDYFLIRTSDAANNNIGYDLLNGTVTYTASGYTSFIEPYGNDWYRIGFVRSFTASSITINFRPNPTIISTNALDNFTGDGTSGGFVWGAQFEAGSYATSYIPNFGTALGVTRSAETCNNAGDVNTFNDSEGVLFVEIEGNEDGTNKFITISDGSIQNRVTIIFLSNNIVAQIRASNSEVFYQTTSGISIENYNKIAVHYKTNQCKLFVNGFQIGSTDTSATMPSGLDELAFDSGSGATPLYGNTKQIQYFNTALNDSDLETLTSWDSFSDMAIGQLYTIE